MTVIFVSDRTTFGTPSRYLEHGYMTSRKFSDGYWSQNFLVNLHNPGQILEILRHCSKKNNFFYISRLLKCFVHRMTMRVGALESHNLRQASKYPEHILLTSRIYLWVTEVTNFFQKWMFEFKRKRMIKSPQPPYPARWEFNHSVYNTTENYNIYSKLLCMYICGFTLLPVLPRQAP